MANITWGGPALQYQSLMVLVCSRTFCQTSKSLFLWIQCNWFLLLSPKIDEIWAHGVLLTASQFIHTKSLVQIKIKYGEAPEHCSIDPKSLPSSCAHQSSRPWHPNACPPPRLLKHKSCWNLRDTDISITSKVLKNKVRHWPDIPVHVSLCNIPWSWGRRTPSTCSSPSTCPWTSNWWRCAPPLEIRGFKKRKNLWILNAFISKENTQQFLKKIPLFS